MLLKKIKIALVILFFLVAVVFCISVVYQYTCKDISKPIIICDENALVLDVSVYASDEELCAGLHAYDNIDGDITSQIVVQKVSQLISNNEALATYLVFDEASNSAQYTRTIRYTDYQRPHFSLSKPLVYKTGDITLLDRLTAYDVLDGDLSHRIIFAETNIAASVPGNYSVTVQVTNSAGDTALLPLSVIITSGSTTLPTIYLKDYLIYVPAGTQVDFTDYLSSVSDPLNKQRIPLSDVFIEADEVDLSTPGNYEVFYHYIGASGEAATVVLTVVVE